MSIIQDVEAKAQGWLLKVAVRKAAKAAVAALVGLAASAKVAPILQQAGVTIDPAQMEIGLMALGASGVAMLFDYLKLKTSFGQKYL